MRRTSWVVWKTSQHHCIFILITVIIILITIISIVIVIYHCINRHILYNRRFLSIVFRRRYRPCFPSASRPTPQLRPRRAGFAGFLCRPRFRIHPFTIITIIDHLSHLIKIIIIVIVQFAPAPAPAPAPLYNHTTVIFYHLHH